ncbi:ATP-binding cassette domain-containing protein [Cohnella sp. CFH 77786]|uniref:ABC transporter ATP-binding protein n=1 Tax=Cohnella sp. CFH 77786 TaxID=2662265 RepID=UPI001C61106F|nr:ABC transporter ATP-binding protein [Cohnella sp. CFH 77786]MBW5446028.1 ATP-binding cassette domain-containing protein [Cohnella sp. CFH 77786]
MSQAPNNPSAASARPAAGPGIGGFGGGHPGRGGPVAKPKDWKTTLRRLWSYFGKEKALLAFIFAMVLADSAITLAGPYLIGVAIDSMSPEGGYVDFTRLEIALIALVSAYATDGALTFAQGWLMAGVSQRMVMSLRRALFAKIQKLPLRFFDTRSHGELMSRLSNDIDNVSTTVAQAVVQAMTGSISILGALAMMLYLSPLLTLASLITVPAVFLLTKTIARKTGPLFKEQQVRLGVLNGHVEETISGIHIVKAFNREQEVIREFDAINEELCRVGIQAQIRSGFLMPIMNVIGNLGFAAIAITGAWLAVESLITVGVIASFLSYSRQFVRPLNDLANTFNLLQSGIAGAERVFEVLDEEEEPADRPEAVPLDRPDGHVRFERVDFGYRPDVPILRDISFEAPAGSSTALVGPTGAGKTTIVNLLTRFYDVTGGSIRIDGRDIRDYTLDSLRRCFGIVLQDTYLFSGTIKENIGYGKPDATDGEIREAASMAGAEAFIRRLPNGYDTVLSENGGNLSQGQRQLLAIARVFLAKPSILILDEATSSIDTRTELQIQEALLQAMKGRTSFIIAHRLNTIREADRIMVIDQGQIVEQGSHDELMARQGVYYGMFMNQFGHLESAAGH